MTARVQRYFACLLVLAGCRGVPDVERDPAPMTQTAELRYPIERHDFGYSARIAYVFRNETDAAVRLAECAGDTRPLLQVRRNGIWVDAWHPLGIRCEDPPLVIDPGASFADTLTVVGGPPGSNVTPTFVFEDVEGVYRLYWFQARRGEVAADEPADPDDAWRVSNPFVLAFH